MITLWFIRSTPPNKSVTFLDIGTAEDGLGPRFNSNQCSSCHSQPAIGGTSPAKNPLIAVATLDSARNIVPWCIAPDGPIREARLKKNPDGTPKGGVRALFVISGRADAPGCDIAQPDFLPAGDPHTGQEGTPISYCEFQHPFSATGLSRRFPMRRFLQT